MRRVLASSRHLTQPLSSFDLCWFCSSDLLSRDANGVDDFPEVVHPVVFVSQRGCALCMCLTCVAPFARTAPYARAAPPRWGA